MLNADARPDSKTAVVLVEGDEVESVRHGDGLDVWPRIGCLEMMSGKRAQSPDGSPSSLCAGWRDRCELGVGPRQAGACMGPTTCICTEYSIAGFMAGREIHESPQPAITGTSHIIRADPLYNTNTLATSGLMLPPRPASWVCFGLSRAGYVQAGGKGSVLETDSNRTPDKSIR